MATSPSKPELAKQLKEYLQEQQEPFKLSTYLSKRRNSLKKLSSNGENNSSLRNCTSNQKGSCSLRKKHILYSSSPRNLKSLLYKLIAPNEKQEPSACNNKAVQEKLVSETMDMIRHIAETNWFSTANNVSSFGAALDYGNGSLVAETSQALNVKHSKQEKTDTDMHQQWGSKKDDKQLITVTESKDLASGKGSKFPFNKSTASKRTQEFNRSFVIARSFYFYFHETCTSNSNSRLNQANGEHLFSAYLLKPLVKSLAERHIQVRLTRAMERVDSGKIKRVLLPSKRLLFDCMKKTVVNNVRNYKRQKHLHKFLSLEELGSIIGRQLCSLGKQLVNATNAAPLINLEFSSTPEEWNYFQQTKGQICREMGDSIIHEIINEIIDFQ